MTYPNEIRLFYSADVNLAVDLDSLSTGVSLSRLFNPHDAKPKTLLKTADTKNVHWTSYPLRPCPAQLEVSYFYGKKHSGPGIHVDASENFDALYVLERRYVRKDGTVVEVFHFDSLSEDVDGHWIEQLYGDPL